MNTPSKRLICITLADPSLNPFPELAPATLARDGWDITFVAPNATASVMRRVMDYPCRRHDLPVLQAGRWRHELALQSWLQKARFGPYDVIYLHSQNLGAHAALGLAGPLFGKRIIHHTHDFYDPVTHPRYARLEGHIARRAAAHLNGEFHRAYFCQTLYGLRCPVYVVPPHLPADWPIPPRSQEVRNRLGARHADDVLLMLHGGPAPLRATEQLLAAVALLPARFRLVMTARRGPSLDSELLRLGIGDRVICLGPVDYLELFSYTSSADIGIMLHVNNDLGNFFQGPGRLTEYIACGLPVLASHFTGLQVLVARHNIGACTNPGSPEEIASRLLELEGGLRGGRFNRAAIRRRFLEAFAFDHWERTVRDVFMQALKPSKFPRCSPPPDFARIGSPLYADAALAASADAGFNSAAEGQSRHEIAV
jgi:glycosyltransferase involved in cell wall biosynthesis